MDDARIGAAILLLGIWTELDLGAVAPR